ncbi:MAG TPA: CAP domain-containing protein [Polyangiaceae bacterium]|nr:CAP domain-containing protein [Polyangiaceae bacterium]
MRSRLAAVFVCAAFLEAGCSSASDPSFGTGDDGTDAASGEDASTGQTPDGSSAATSGGDDATSPGPSDDASAGGGGHDAAGSGHGKDAATGTDAGNEGDAEAANGETGREVGMTAAHNAVRAMVQTTPALPDLVWSTTLAEYAQQWATQLAGSASTCAQPVHRTEAELQAKGYGENLAAFEGGSFGGIGGMTSSAPVSTAQQAVNGWAGEVACWTYGKFMSTDKCDMTCTTNMHSDGCGHYTQIVWRKTMQLGCGVATCMNGKATEDIWICNYAPAGNIVGQLPY